MNHDTSKLSWLGPNMSFRPELVEVMAKLIDAQAIGSVHLAAIEPHATYEEVNDALTACQDALTEDRDKRQVYRGEDPVTDRLEKIYNALAAAINHYDLAERELELAGEDALTAKQLLLGEIG